MHATLHAALPAAIRHRAGQEMRGRLASMSIRRVVTGVNAEGTSRFASDESMEAVAPAFMPGLEFDTNVTIDFEYVVSGRVVLELDDGASVELGPGDTVVQNGTRHAWRDPFDETATLVVVPIGATPA
jgi:hypothetical protein